MIDSGQGQNTTEDTFDRAQEAFDQGDFGTALTMFLQIAFSESDFDACYNAGNAAERLGDLRAAEALLRIAREAGVTDAGRNLAHILLNTDRRAAAIAAYREAAEAGDRNAAIDLGELHEEDGELSDALTWYRRAYDEPDAYLRVARVSRRLGDETGAVEALRLGSEVAGDAAAEYAEILYAQGNRQEALDVLWRASRIDPDRALVPLAYTLDEMGDIAGATCSARGHRA